MANPRAGIHPLRVSSTGIWALRQPGHTPRTKHRSPQFLTRHRADNYFQTLQSIRSFAQRRTRFTDAMPMADGDAQSPTLDFNFKQDGYFLIHGGSDAPLLHTRVLSNHRS
jgi:hypothetical protein